MIDKIAREHGHEIVRLPPYHCQYNPIEMIWSQLKGLVGKKNKTFTIADLKTLTRDAVGKKISINLNNQYQTYHIVYCR